MTTVAMTPKRYAIDAAVAIRLAGETARIYDDHQLVARTPSARRRSDSLNGRFGAVN